MDSTILERHLRLITLLVDNSRYTLDDLSERLETSKRTVYRYIEQLDMIGFIIENHQGIYSINPASPFIKSVAKATKFTGMEIDIMNQLLAEADPTNMAVRKLRHKFHSLYNGIIETGERQERLMIMNVETLYNAIRHRRQVIIHDYLSLNSQTVSDRIVEPYKFLSGTTEIRCLELGSLLRKTFKLQRIQGKVEELDKKWEHPTLHVDYYTDIFGFSSEKRERITLRLGALSTRILMEEYGVDRQQFTLCDDGTSLITLHVCSYKGVTRYVLGLMDDIQIVDNDRFRHHLSNIIKGCTL